MAVLPSSSSGKVVKVGSADGQQQHQPCEFTTIGMNDILLTEGTSSYLVDEHGKIASSSPPLLSSWKASPRAVDFVPSRHVVALQPNGIEIQVYPNTSDVRLSQYIPLDDAAMDTISCIGVVVPGKAVAAVVAVATPTQVYCFSATPMKQQCEQLLKLGAFEEALMACKEIKGAQVCLFLGRGVFTELSLSPPLLCV